MKTQQKRIARVGNAFRLYFENGLFTTIDRQDADLIDLNWRLAKNKEYAHGGYHVKRSTTVNGKQKTEYLHRVILERKLGRVLSSKEMTDHIHGNTLDNRRSQLRLASHSQNAANTNCRIDSKTGIKGVRTAQRTEGKFTARIRVRGIRYHLGTYDSAEAASVAYTQAAKLIWGEFARVDYQAVA